MVGRDALMALKLTGNTSALLKLGKQLNDASLAAKISRNQAEAALDLVLEGAANEQDPWGNQWEPLVLREGKIGRNTSGGGMLGSLHLSSPPTDRGFTLAFGKHYAVYFHGGTGIYGPRKQRIRPVNAKVLAFSVRGAKGFTGSKKGKGTKGFFFASVKGSPPRPLFPAGGRCPPAWRAELKATADEVVRKHFAK